MENAATATLAARPPQISEMFQKFASAFKTKTFEFFAEDGSGEPTDSDGLFLLDSAEDFITDQKVVVIKPDPLPRSSSARKIVAQSSRTVDTQMRESLISSIFATICSFESSYLQLQTSHVPFVEESVEAADKTLVSHLQRLSDLKKFYGDYARNPGCASGSSLGIGSCLEAQVQENQSKLRTLETVSNQLQEEIDQKDSEVSALKKKLGELRWANTKLSKRLSANLDSACDVVFSLKVFDTVLHDACRATYKFSRVLIELMRRAGWDLDLVANSIYPDLFYAKSGHTKYAFFSYVCLGMFWSFDSEDFGLSESNSACNGHDPALSNATHSVKQLLEHVSSNPMDLLSMNTNCDFSRFCEKKYQDLIHPKMESSIFRNMDRHEVVLNSWRSLSTFYESFVNMASAIWTLNKLALSFDPVVEIYQVEKGAEFSMVYMEDVTKRCGLLDRANLKVGFTVVPGFKFRNTIIQSQVYLTVPTLSD